MSNVISRLSETPGEVRHPGGGHGEHTVSVLGELGIGPDELTRLRREGVV
jgi:crotonobetainyl-CoA:carnitine CoA-transferase CaiB-like acyl-CoA transferase